MLALALILAAAPAQDTVTFAITMVNDQHIDASAAGQGVMENVMTIDGRLSVVIRDTTEGYLATVIVDTATVEATMQQMPASMLAIPSGLTFHLHVVDGTVASGLDPAAMGEQPTMGGILAMGQVGSLFHRTHPGAKVGATWSDTVAVDTTQNGMRSTGVTITDWTATAVEEDRTTLRGISEGNMSGQMGGMGESSMVMRGTTVAVIDGRGLVVSLETTGTNDVQMVMGTQGGMSMEQETRLTISRRE